MRFLVDANLPRNLKWFNAPDFTFAADWGDGFPDREIWEYALNNDLIIITRDSDYFYWLMQAEKSPKVIYFKLQQQGRKQLEEYFELNWKQICELIGTCRMIVATTDSLDVF
jgi:predicted nuclease of predicted toxin-antitoxin system